MVLLYQNSALRQCENLVYQKTEVTADELMLRAGRATWDCLQQRYPRAEVIIVCCGKGNNAGDGLVVAHLAHASGVKVKVVFAESEVTTAPAKQVLQTCKTAGVCFCAEDDALFATADVIVDALLGTGVQGELRQPYVNIINKMNAAGKPILSIDIPTGLDADTGAAQESVIMADTTVTFIGCKPGLVTGKGIAVCGTVRLTDLAIARGELQQMQACAEILTWEYVRPHITKRCRNSHKGDHGHVLVIGGDYGMGGAVRMSAEAALRAGAGLVTVATRPEHVPIVSGTRPELMCYQVTDGSDLQPLIDKANVVVIGPGLGKSAWAEDLLQTVMNSKTKTVYDADALNLISQMQEQVDLSNAVITPHPGEAARLLDCTNAQIQADRYLKLDELVARYKAITVLKGAGSLVGTNAELTKVCQAGNPGMATAGMGDVLTGVIGAMMAQGMSLYDAACTGVLIHSLAADVAAEKDGERGLLATDLLEYIRELVNPDAG